MPKNFIIIGLNGQPVNFADCTIQLCPLEYAQIEYVPNKAVNMAYLIIFALLLAVQIIQLGFYRTWGYSIGIFCGLVLEVVGYVGRLMLHNNPFIFGSFVTYLVCLTLAPALISASIYLCLSRIVVAHGEKVAPLRPQTYALTFMCFDFVSLVLQAVGGAMAATSNNNVKLGKTGIHIMQAGLAFQVVSLTIFSVLCLDLVRRYRSAAPSSKNPAFADLRARTLFKLFPFALGLATLTIFTRSVFRVAELNGGFRGKLANNEKAFDGLEGPMIIIAVLALTVFHPGFCFRGAWRLANWNFGKQAPATEMQYLKPNEEYQSRA